MPHVKKKKQKKQNKTNLGSTLFAWPLHQDIL